MTSQAAPGPEVSDDRTVVVPSVGERHSVLRVPTRGAADQESLHMQLRKIIKDRGHLPSDEAATKLLWLALRNINDGKV